MDILLLEKLVGNFWNFFFKVMNAEIVKRFNNQNSQFDQGLSSDHLQLFEGKKPGEAEGPSEVQA